MKSIDPDLQNKKRITGKAFDTGENDQFKNHGPLFFFFITDIPDFPGKGGSDLLQTADLWTDLYSSRKDTGNRFGLAPLD